MEGEDYREITRRALKDWSDSSLFNIDDYGYLLESYVYNVNDVTGEVIDVSYNRFNPDGTPEKTVYVETRDGLYKRSVVLWPNVDNQELINGYLSSNVLTMKLDLETIDPDFSLDKVKVYSADTKDPRIHRILGNSAFYYFDIDIDETLDRCTVKYPIERIPCKTKESWIEVDSDMTVSYYEDLGIYRLYHKDQNYAETEIRIFPNCMVEINYFDDMISVCYFDDGDIERFYLKEETDSQIDCLSDCAYDILEFGNNSINNMKYTYDEDCLIQDVTHTYDNAKGAKIIRFGKDKKSVCRVETYSNNSGYPDDGPYKRSEYASLYPAGVTLNNENFMYKFWKLWSYDKVEFDDISGGINMFSRYIYYIRDDALKELINDLNMYPEDPILF